MLLNHTQYCIAQYLKLALSKDRIKLQVVMINTLLPVREEAIAKTPFQSMPVISLCL